MPWSKEPFDSKDPETGEVGETKVKTDDEGFVSDVIDNLDQDSSGGKHGHVWGLNSDIPDNPEDDPIGGRDAVDSSGKSIYGDAESDADGDDGDSGDSDGGDAGDAGDAGDGGGDGGDGGGGGGGGE